MTNLSSTMEHELTKCNDFKEFFIKVSKAKLELNRIGLHELSCFIERFTIRYGTESILYLKDSLIAESLLPCNQVESRKSLEKDMVTKIIDDFDTYFPNYQFLRREAPVDGIGRIDILAVDKKSGRIVVIEAKSDIANPNKQLLAYGSKYINPILVAINGGKLNDSNLLKDIMYYTYADGTLELYFAAHQQAAA